MTAHTNRFRGPGWPTFATELLEARERLTLPDHVGLALRAHRRLLGLSQRAYAMHRGWPKYLVAKLESRAEQVSFGDVIGALDDTGYQLCLVKSLDGEAAGAAAHVVTPTHWDRVELLAKVRGGLRRFPAHRETQQVSHPPRWWWDRESTLACAEAPNWYAPLHSADVVIPASDLHPGDEDSDEGLPKAS